MRPFLQKGREGMQNLMRRGNWKKRNQEQCSLNLTGLHSEIGTKEQAVVLDRRRRSKTLHEAPMARAMPITQTIMSGPNIQVKGPEPAEEHGDVQPKEELQEKPGTVMGPEPAEEHGDVQPKEELQCIIVEPWQIPTNPS
ncbi:hypothetical protein SADUNF_Sadunf19G0091600 [Salix dunnii]|uniref:Uncharacterized protein n=1 Tax=Salix dunnii TaxID=1413687 RepID=A0A835MLC7_9ROSI|nr:hypothetical protein SADUNF_Sadunf19G0091600 [Salix dunnii]